MPYLSLLGLYVSGDVGGYTLYTTRKGRVVVYPKSPPNKPPTYLQLQQRARFRWAQQQWSALSLGLKSQWEQLVLKSSLDMTGQNAFISLSLSPDNPKLDSLNRRARLSLSPPPIAPG